MEAISFPVHRDSDSPWFLTSNYYIDPERKAVANNLGTYPQFTQETLRCSKSWTDTNPTTETQEYTCIYNYRKPKNFKKKTNYFFSFSFFLIRELKNILHQNPYEFANFSKNSKVKLNTQSLETKPLVNFLLMTCHFY